MMRPFSALSLFLEKRTHEEIIELCLKAGFSGIEAHSFMSEGIEESRLIAIGEQYRAAGLKIDSFHLPFMDLSALDESKRVEAVGCFKAALRQAGAFGVRVGIAHPTRHGCVTTHGIGPLVDALERSLRELLPLAENLGIVIALENLAPAGIDRLGSAPGHFEVFKTRFAHQSIGFCLDTGHALLALHDRANELADAMADRLEAFHLNDNSGDRDSHLAPGRGFVNWPAISQLMDRIGFQHAACIETPPFAYGPDYSLQSWCQLRADTDRLLSSSLMP